MSYYSPELWPADRPAILSPADLHQAIICVNACRHLPIEYLEWLADQERFLCGTSLREVGACVEAFEKAIGPEQLKRFGWSMQKLLDALDDAGCDADTALGRADDASGTCDRPGP